MTYANIQTTAAARPSALRRFGSAVLDTIEFLATSGPRTEALRRLSAATDEQLAARGTTRDAEVRRIIGIRSLV